MCTNATCVPAASMAARRFATLANVSRQNVHPKWRRKINSSGPRCCMSCSGAGSSMPW
jgi:hypothetical protein